MPLEMMDTIERQPPTERPLLVMHFPSPATPRASNYVSKLELFPRSHQEGSSVSTDRSFVSSRNTYSTAGTETSSTSGSRSKAPVTSSILCSRCSSLDFHALVQKPVVSYSLSGDLVAELGHLVSALRISSCPLCRFFGSVARHELYGKIELRAVPADLIFTGLRLGKNFNKNVFTVGCSGVVTTFRHHHFGLIDPETPKQVSADDFGVRILDNEHFDIELVRKWLRFCKCNHETDCKATALLATSSFRMIDCETQAVVNAPPRCQFVALSYVWARKEPSKESPSLLGIEDAPKVVADSMEVTKRLGYRYLWVDRYCINQSDAAESHDQISRMDNIYTSAQVTIVAAAGDGPDYGLPGVRGTRREPQLAAHVGKCQLVSSLHTPTSTLADTTWAKRGWTYQEGLLSKRRLIFCKDQVFFECNGMQCSEVLNVPLELLHDRNTGRAKADVPLGAFHLKTIGDDPWEVMEYVSAFARRQLSYTSDAINAVRGIFRVFENSRYPLYHLMGVPIMPPYVDSGVSETPMSEIPRSPEEGFMIGLMWHHQYPRPERCFRRPDFPSWTWAGWNGWIEASLEFSPTSKECGIGAHVSVEKTDGSLLPFPAEYSSLPQYLSLVHEANFIHVTAKTSTCEIASRGPVGHYGIRYKVEEMHKSPYLALISGGESADVCLQFVPGDVLCSEFLPSEPPSLLGKKFTAIIFAPDTEPEALDWQVSVLVVEEKGDFVERVGICLKTEASDLEEIVQKQRLVPNGGSVRSFSYREHTAEDKQRNRQAFMEWYESLESRTIRIG